MENIAENNRLIAEFMGWEEQKDDTKRWYGQWFDNITGERHTYLFFNTSWDWLMTVVEKINTIDDYRFTVNIQSMDVQIQDHLEGGNIIDFFSGEGTDKLINSVYTACVEFVKWHNQQGGN